jgi:outer membrane lipoprotein carrier protein
MFRILMVFPLAALLFQGGPVFAEEDLATIIQGVRNKYQELPGLKVDYTREVVTRSMSLLGGDVKGDLATGQIYFKPPYSMKLEQKEPRQETLVTDGGTLWWYIPEDKEAFEYPTDQFGKELKLLSDIFRGLSQVEENFRVILLGRTPEGSARIELLPDPPWQEVERIEILVTREKVIRQVEILNQMGSTTRFILGEFDVMNQFPDGFFRFAPPPGLTIQKEEG